MEMFVAFGPIDSNRLPLGKRSCRLEIGRAAAQIIANRLAEPPVECETQITLSPTISYGDTLRRR